MHGDTRLHADRCRLQTQLVDYRCQAEGGQRAIEPPVDGVGVVVEVERVAEVHREVLGSVVGLAEAGAAGALQVAVEAGDLLPRAGGLGDAHELDIRLVFGAFLTRQTHAVRIAIRDLQLVQWLYTVPGSRGLSTLQITAM